MHFKGNENILKISGEIFGRFKKMSYIWDVLREKEKYFKNFRKL